MRLTSKDKHEDATEPGDRLLTIFLGKDTYYFSTSCLK